MRSGGRAGSVQSPERYRPEREDAWLAASLALATLIALLDGLSQGTIVLVALLSIPSVLASATTGLRSTVLVAGYALVLAIFCGFWDETLADRDYWVRVTLVTVIGGLATWNAALREELYAGARGAALLAQGLTRLHAEPLGEAEAADRVARIAVPGVADICVLDLLMDDGTIGAGAIAAEDPEVEKEIAATRKRLRIDPGSEHPIAKVIRERERRNFKRLTKQQTAEMAITPTHLKMLRSVGPRSMLIVPMIIRGEAIGAISLGSLGRGGGFGPGEIGFAETLARRAASAISNARLLEEQSAFATALQRALLPPELPPIKGLEIAARFRPLGRANLIGGDFYDLFQRGASSWTAVIGDVCGKGPEAAALTALMRDTLRASALRDETPAESLGLLNAAILEAGADWRFCTCAAVRIDRGARTTLTISNGGHPPPLLLRSRSGKVESLGPSGTLLGIYEDVELVNTSVRLGKGDALLLYTDGLFEAPPGHGSTIVAVDEILAECAGLDAEAAAAKIEGRVLEGHGGHPADDIAIMVIRRM